MITFHEMTKAQYLNITPTNDGVYFINDTGEIYYNGVLYTDTLKINNDLIKTFSFENINYQYNADTKDAKLSLNYANNQKNGIVKLANEITDNTSIAVTANAVKKYVDNNIKQQKQYVDSKAVTINSLIDNVQITAGNGINIQTSNNNIVISNAHDSNSTTNNSLLIKLDASNYQSDLYSVTYNNTDKTIVIKHNFNSRCIGIVYDQNNKQQNIGIDYVDDNTVKLQFDSNTMPTSTKIKNICLGPVGSKQQYLFVSGSKPNLVKQIQHNTYGIVGKLGDSETIKFKGYNANGITQLELWLVNENGQSGNIVLNIGEQKRLVYVNNELTKNIITLNGRVKGIIQISRDMNNAKNEIYSDVVVVDWTLYSENCSSQYLDCPYIMKNVSGEIKINANNGLHQVIDGTCGDTVLYCANIVNLKQNQTIKVRFQNVHNQIVVNNSYIGRQFNSFYVMFTKINGVVKQIGNVIQVE